MLKRQLLRAAALAAALTPVLAAAQHSTPHAASVTTQASTQMTPQTAAQLAGTSSNGDAPRSSYQQPSPAVRELLDAPALPRFTVSPDRQTLATLELRRFNTIEELARPVLRLAGLRFEAGSASPQTITPIQKLRLRKLLSPDAAELVVELPGAENPKNGSFHSFGWAPDGQHFLLERRTPLASELWLGDSASGRLRQLPGVKLNGVLAPGDPLWLNARELLVLTRPDRQGAPPALPRAPAGPAVQESFNRNSPERTYPDLLKNAHDEALFEHHARSQLTQIDVLSGAVQSFCPAPSLRRGLRRPCCRCR